MNEIENLYYKYDVQMGISLSSFKKLVGELLK